MIITLNFLKSKWGNIQRSKIRNYGFWIGSDKFLNKKYHKYLFLLDAIWSNNHDGTVNRRNKTKEAKHIFISQICDVAVEEYKTVCKLLKYKKIIIVGVRGDTLFFANSFGFLQRLPNVEIITLEI